MNPPTTESIAKYWRGPQLGLYIPVIYTVWAGLAWLVRLPIADAGGITLDPSVFHTANLIGHGLASFLCWQILRRLIPVSKARDWAAGAGAILFALHPLQAEPVAWVTGFKDVLSGVFAFVCCCSTSSDWRRSTRVIARFKGSGLPWQHPSTQ